MPWREVSTMSLRREFIGYVEAEGANIAALCRQFGISRKTAYKWLERYRAEGIEGLIDRSRRPHHSPLQVSEDIEKAVLEVRGSHQTWGGRKIRAVLLRQGLADVPAASTITTILARHQLLDPTEREKHQPWQRFEHDAPNRLWQMDYKGYFKTEAAICHALTILDDHSRFSICLKACANEKRETVQEALLEMFRRYGLPERMTMDNGSPWGVSLPERALTQLELWLIRLGIRVGHSRPCHPQTQGKDERFHRTLKAELLTYQTFRDLVHCQKHFDQWRDVYNFERPHEALGMKVPAQRYHPSKREYPEKLPPIDYAPGDIVRKVQDGGFIRFKGQAFRVGKALKGYPVALRPTLSENIFEVYFCHHKVTEVDLNQERYANV